MNWYGEHILILGLGNSGLATARWLSHRGADLRVADSAAQPANLPALLALNAEIKITTGEFLAEDFMWADRIVISPGVPVNQPLIQAAIARGVSVWSDVELFAQALPEQAGVIAITGSNGKSTVTTMVDAMCRAAGKKAVMAGNIGLPVLDALENHPETELFVLELSSFQLETTYTLHPIAATVLNVSEDHLDRYVDMDEYAATKARIFKPGGVQVLNREDARSMAMAQHEVVTFGLDASEQDSEYGIRDGYLCRGKQHLMAVADLPLAGLHNAANALAAWALCAAAGLPDAPLAKAMREFKGLAHRVEWVAKVGGVDFYDDSKGTNVGATVAALNGMAQPVVLIVGGEGKGQDFTPLAAAVKKSARAVVQIGRDGELIAAAIASAGVPVLRAESMASAVTLGYAHAQMGDAVLLSPACASFDMFKNYAHRAEMFVSAVRQLPEVRHG